MRKLFFTILIAAFAATTYQAQIINNLDLQKATPEERKELIKNLSAEERRELLKQFRENMLVDDLKVPEKDQKEFKRVYNEYQESQRRIKEQFNNDFDPEKLSDEEAKRKLEESFELGQKLMDSRKEYARKMQDVVKPQQVPKMFQNEGQMRDKMLDRRMEMRNDNSTRNPGFRNDNPSQIRRDQPTPSMRNGNPPAGMRSGGTSGIRSNTRGGGFR